MKPARKIYNWAANKARSKHSTFWLGLVFSMELLLFVPLDAILALFCFENPKKKYLYSIVATSISAFSACVGYLIGFALWDVISPYVVGHLISIKFFNQLVQHYQTHEALAAFIGSFLPIPFKAVSLSAGACHVALVFFIIYVVLGRACRFFLVAGMIHTWGLKIKKFVDRHFNRILMAVGAKIALTLTFFWALGH